MFVSSLQNRQKRWGEPKLYKEATRFLKWKHFHVLRNTFRFCFGLCPAAVWCWCKDIWRIMCTLHSVLPQFSTIFSATRTERWELGVFNLFRFAPLWSLHKEQAAFPPPKKRYNKRLSHTTCAIFCLECPDVSKNTSVYTHIIDGVSMGPLIGATLPKAGNILYAGTQALIAMQVRRLQALLHSERRQITIYNAMQGG